MDNKDEAIIVNYGKHSHYTDLSYAQMVEKTQLTFSINQSLIWWLTLWVILLGLERGQTLVKLKVCCRTSKWWFKDGLSRTKNKVPIHTSKQLAVQLVPRIVKLFNSWRYLDGLNSQAIEATVCSTEISVRSLEIESI